MNLVSQEKMYDCSIEELEQIIRAKLLIPDKDEVDILPQIERKWDGEYERDIFKGLTITVSS